MNFKSRDKKSFNLATEPILIHRKDTKDGQSYSGNMLNFMENWSFNKLSKFNKLNKFTTSLIIQATRGNISPDSQPTIQTYQLITTLICLMFKNNKGKNEVVLRSLLLTLNIFNTFL